MAASEITTTNEATDLEAELTREIDGEVHFDTISRALYATDASVYQIIPQGVVTNL